MPDLEEKPRSHNNRKKLNCFLTPSSLARKNFQYKKKSKEKARLQGADQVRGDYSSFVKNSERFKVMRNRFCQITKRLAGLVKLFSLLG